MWRCACFVSSRNSAAIQVLAPYTAACLGKVYPGPGPTLQLAAACAPLAELLAAWQPPRPKPAAPPARQPSSSGKSLHTHVCTPFQGQYA